MTNFTLSAFADEIDGDLAVQIKELLANNISYMELRSIDGVNVSKFTYNEVKLFKELLDASGVKVSAIGSPIGKISITDDFEPELEKFKSVLIATKAFDCKYIRMFSFYIPEGEDPAKYRDEVIARWKAFLKVAEGTGITLLSENEKGIYCDNAERSLDLIKSVGSGAGLTFDPANFVQCGENVSNAVNILMPYIEYVHIKDALRETGEVVPAGYGDGEILALLSSLKNNNYKGFLSLEPHLADFSGFKDLENDRDKIESKLTGIESFNLAVNALTKLLNQL